MYADMEWWMEVRRRVPVEGVSKREILRETGLHWQTLEKILQLSQPPGYRLRQPRPRPKTGPYLERIRQILEADQEVPSKQRHSAKRLCERLRELSRRRRGRVSLLSLTLTHPDRAVGWGRVRLGSGDFVKGGRRSGVGKKVILFGLLVLCSLGFLAASVQAGVIEKWHMVQRMRWTGNHGQHGYAVFEGELWVTTSGYQATNISSKGSAYLWDGAFTAPNQPWRDPAVKVNHLVFDALTPAGGVVVGDLRPNWNWKRLTGRITATEPVPLLPGTSYYYEITVTATRL